MKIEEFDNSIDLGNTPTPEEFYNDRGFEQPKMKQAQIKIRSFPQDLWREFLGEGKKKGKTAAKITAEAIEMWLKKNKKNKETPGKPNKFDECHRCGTHFTPGVGYTVTASPITGENVFICTKCAAK